MTQQGKDFILYMYQQFPATVGHIPMKEMVDKIEQNVRQSALDEAAELIDNNAKHLSGGGMARGVLLESRAAILSLKQKQP